AFLLHRPCFFGKVFTSIVTQGIFGGNSIIKYLGNMGKNLGYHVTKGCVLNTLEPTTKSAQENNSLKIKKAAARFYRVLMRKTAPNPSLFRLMMFRISRTRMKDMLSDEYYDYRYYKAKGWFESDYYYDVTLKPFKKLMGWFFDLAGHRLAKQN
ncbi:MAG: multimeric flavodoxin WrbA, partial [Lacrimispora sp.]|nr:multimeric flavodoxin WrbA [Lacrimispora sp.]